MTWTVTFYNSKVEQDTLALSASILANFLRIAELIEEYWPDLGRPHTAPLGKGLFEIRARGRQGIARSIFCTVKNREIVILLTVIKKSNALPKRTMNLVVRRQQEIQNHD